MLFYIGFSNLDFFFGNNSSHSTSSFDRQSKIGRILKCYFHILLLSKIAKIMLRMITRSHQEPLQFKTYCPIYTFVIVIQPPTATILFFPNSHKSLRSQCNLATRAKNFKHKAKPWWTSWKRALKWLWYTDGENSSQKKSLVVKEEHTCL